MQYGTKALQALCLRGGSAPQAQLADDIGIAEERLSPVAAGLQHNGYVVRTFAPEGAVLTLTDDGRRWLSKQGVAVPEQAASVPPAAPRAEPAAPKRQAAAMPSRRAGGAKSAEAAGVVVERRRGRRPKPTADADGDEIATDESGFVTHIKGKAIF